MKALLPIALTLFSFASLQPANAAQRQLREMFIDSQGARLFCRVIGEGDPIIVVHGGPGLSQDYLQPQMTRLAENHQVIFYDQRGCGRSTGELTSDSINIKNFIEDIEAVRKSFGLNKITLIGHSWGGLLSAHYAAKYPDNLHKLVFLNSVPLTSDEFSLFTGEWIKRMSPHFAQIDSIKRSSKFIDRDPETIKAYYHMIFSQYCFDPEKSKLLQIKMNRRAFDQGERVYEIFRDTLLSGSFNFQDPLRNLAIPTLILHGDSDIVPPRSIQPLQATCRNSFFVVLKECGHFPYIEAPERFFPALEAFLQEERQQ